MSPRVGVVGAGISGVACARVLRAAGIDVVVHERSHGVGGRMASPRLHERRVDTGAAYFTVEGDGFTAQAREWQRRGLAGPWTDTLGVWADGEMGSKQGPDRWHAPGGLRSLVEDLATDLDVRLASPVTVVGPGPALDGTTYDTVVLAMPDPQALRLLDDSHDGARAQLAGRTWDPVLTVVVGALERTWGELSAAFVNGHPAVALVADDGARRGDGAPVLVAHTTTALAAAHLDDPDAVVPDVLAGLAEILPGTLEVSWTKFHRWGLAKPSAPREVDHWLGGGIGLCGDGWGTSKVGTAWTSGTVLGLELVRELG